MLSVVIPTLKAGGTLAATLDSVLGAGVVDEVVVADGGSADGTHGIAAKAGARIVHCVPGRGGQLAAGARGAAGDWLLFVHADTVLEAGWGDAAQAFMAAPGNAEKAAVFRFALDDTCAAAKRLERIVAWRTRTCGLPYGDQGLLISRHFYDVLGGFAELPLMEDVDMVRRIGKARLVMLDPLAVTSAEKYRREGYVRRSARNLLCLALYLAGVAPARIARFYG